MASGQVVTSSSESTSASVADSVACVGRSIFFAFNACVKFIVMSPVSPCGRPVFFGVNRSMFLNGDKFKILNSVIKSFSVKMVDLFSFSKFSAKVIFHYKSMFKKSFSILSDRLIAVIKNATRTKFSSLSRMIGVSVSPFSHGMSGTQTALDRPCFV